MASQSLLDEARQCRLIARQLQGKPEADFLMRVATAFEDLDVSNARSLRTGGGAVARRRSR